MGNSIAKPLLGQNNAPVSIRKQLLMEKFETTTIIDCLHACMFPVGQESLAVSCLHRVPPGWQSLCDLHALLDAPEPPTLYLEAVLALIAELEDGEEVLRCLLQGCFESLLRPRSAKDLQNQLLKYTLLLTCLQRVLEVTKEALQEAECQVLFSSASYYLEIVEEYKVIVEHWGSYAEVSNGILGSSSVLYEFFRGFKGVLDIEKLFYAFMTNTDNGCVDVQESEALTIKLECNHKYLPVAQYAFARKLSESNPKKALEIFLAISSQIASHFPGGEVEYLREVMKILPEEQAMQIVQILLLLNGEEDGNLEGQVQRRLDLNGHSDTMVERLIRYFLYKGDVESAVHFIRKFNAKHLLYLLKEVDFVGVPLYDLVPQVEELLHGQYKYLAELFTRMWDYRSAAKYLFLNYRVEECIEDLHKCRDFLKRCEPRWQYIQVDNVRIDLKDLLYLEALHIGKEILLKREKRKVTNDSVFETLLSYNHFTEAFNIILTLRCERLESVSAFFEKLAEEFCIAGEDPIPWAVNLLGQAFSRFDQSITVYLIIAHFIDALSAEDRNLAVLACKVVLERIPREEAPEDLMFKFLSIDCNAALKYLRGKMQESYEFYSHYAMDSGMQPARKLLPLP